MIFHGSEGWISDAEGFCASNQSLWKEKFKPSDEQLPVSPEHNRNFIDCVKSRQETMCPVEMAIRCDAICQLATIAAITGRAIQWDPETGEDRQRCGSRQDARPAVPRKMEGLVNHADSLLNSKDSFKAFVELNRNPRLGIALAPYHLQAAGISVEDVIAFLQFAICAVLSLASGLLFERCTVNQIAAASGAIAYIGIMLVGIAFTLQRDNETKS